MTSKEAVPSARDVEAAGAWLRTYLGAHNREPHVTRLAEALATARASGEAAADKRWSEALEADQRSHAQYIHDANVMAESALARVAELEADRSLWRAMADEWRNERDTARNERDTALARVAELPLT